MSEHVMKPTEVTELLNRWSSGDRKALDRLLEHAYAELRRLAQRQRQGEYGPRTVTPTDLLHESLFRVIDIERMDWHNRKQFYAVVVTMMKRVLLDSAHHRKAQKRGGGSVCLPLEAADGADMTSSAHVPRWSSRK